MFDIDYKPMNKTAALVVSKGFEYTPDLKKSDQVESKLPLETKPITDSEKGSSEFEDLTGFKIGRFTVMGRNAVGRGRGWVVRCNCGNYAIRTKKSIQNEKNYGDRCQECRHLAQLKRKDHYRRTGKESCSNDF